ncbi:hypothetical protein PINS_up010771 [Pythium insidiosum]|nr:hypothetical protein PINS_up010771 [Pythium insidiosum]
MRSPRAIALVLALILSLWLPVDAIPAFVGRIPNGDSLLGIDAVGHWNRRGGGELNPFGLDFLVIGNRSWNKALCERDSDGDGHTNGQELGDPCCLWTPKLRALPLWHGPVSHPGNEGIRLNASLVRLTANCSNLSFIIAHTPPSAWNGDAGQSTRCLQMAVVLLSLALAV